MKANVSLPILGIDSGRPGEFIDTRATPDCKNIEFNRFTLQKRTGSTVLGDSLGERILALAELQTDASTTYFLRIGLTTVELFDKVTSTWSDVTGTPLTATSADKVDFTFPTLSGSKILVFTNQVDNIRKYTGSGNTANLGGSPPKSKFCIAHGSYLVLLNIITGAFPSRVQWCDTGDIEDWSTGNAGAQDLLDDPGEITGGGLYGEYITAHKENSIYLGYLVSTSQIYRFDRKETGAGTISNNTIKYLPTGEQIFLASDGLRLFNGMTAPLIPSSVNEDILESLNPQYAYKSWGQIIKEKSEYIIAMPFGNNTEPNVIYRYNYLTRQCYKDDRGSLTACGFYKNITTFTWAQKTNSWASETARWNSATLGSLNQVVVFGDTDGVVTARSQVLNDYDSETISAYWISKDFTAQDLGNPDVGRLVNWTALRIWAKGNSFSFDYSIDTGLTWFFVSDYNLNSSYPSDAAPLFSYFDVVSSQIRFRFSNDNVNESFTLKKFYIDAKLREMSE